MGDSNYIREIIERVVSASLAEHVAALKDELVEKACQELATAIPKSEPVASAPATPPGGAPTDLLNAAVSSVLDSASQTDILTALLEGSSKFAERSALFVIRGGSATGWRGTGLEPRDEIKSVTINLNSGLASRAYHDRVPASASAAEFDSRFVANFGAPADGTNALVLPLVLRDKVAALVYADAGPNPGGKLDPSALECLVRCSGLWLEIVAARKTAPAAETEPDTEKIPRYTEPAAQHEEPASTPAEPPAPAEPARAPQPPPPAAAPEPAFSPAPVAAAAAAAPAAASTAAPSSLTPEEEETHKKAKRFAKLLVDEIKLYNQAKVVEGRSHKDLYARLKDDIDKSRATYDKRYGATSAAGGNYFSRELIRILANDDPSVLGDGFSG